MMPMIARISSRWMRPPATWSENPSSHNTKRTTTTVQIKLTMTNLREMISCYLIAPISYYRGVGVGVNGGGRGPDPGLAPALSSQARRDGHNRASAGTAGDFESAAAVCARAALVGGDWP